jgi:nicotinamidase-related amidase
MKMTLIAAAAVWMMCALVGSEEEPEKVEIKPVLLVIDVQNAWWPMMDAEDRKSAPQKINEAIALFRELGHPVIRVYHTDPHRGPEPGTDAFEFDKSIEVTGDDRKIVKNYPSSFLKTELEKVLRESGCNVVFLSGLSATGCVLATYFGALEREFTPVMVQGALISPCAKHTRMIEEICISMPIEDVKKTLSK